MSEPADPGVVAWASGAGPPVPAAEITMLTLVDGPQVDGLPEGVRLVQPEDIERAARH